MPEVGQVISQYPLTAKLLPRPLLITINLEDQSTLPLASTVIVPPPLRFLLDLCADDLVVALTLLNKLALPVSVAVIVPALKLPDASRATIAEAVFALVAFEVTVNVAAAEPLYVVDPLKPVPDTFIVRVFKLLPSVIPEIVDAANLDTAIAADALMSPLTIVPSAIIVDVTVPESPVVTTVPVVAGNVIVVVPAVAAGWSVTVPDVAPGIAILVIPVNARFAEALFSTIEVVPTNSVELPKTPEGIVPVKLPAGKLVNAAPDPEKVAVIVPALKLPDASLATIAEAVFALVAFEVTVKVAAADPL